MSSIRSRADRRLVGLVAVILLLLAAGVGAGAAPVSASYHPPRIPIRQSTSTNWSGYAAATNLTQPAAGSVSAAVGTWTVPAMDCTTTPNGYSSVWVGIDGYSSSSVEQLGTEQDCRSGSAVYSAWYEMYPKLPVTLSLSVAPGDSISASVTYTGKGNFALSLKNNTKGWTFATTQKNTRAARSSAEWIAEAPSSGGSVLPLADFQTANFRGAQATISGTAGPIDSSSWKNDPITMLDGTATATPGQITDSPGTSAFSVAWAQSTTPPPSSATVTVSSINYRLAPNGNLNITIGVTNDSNANAVSGATVSITLENKSTGQVWSGSGTTGSAGTVTFGLRHAPAGTYTTVVNSVTGSGITWDGSYPTNTYIVP